MHMCGITKVGWWDQLCGGRTDYLVNKKTLNKSSFFEILKIVYAFASDSLMALKFKNTTKKGILWH